MFKPLLRTLPNLSGNVKLNCEITDSKYNSEKNIYETYCRKASLAPINSDIKYVPIKLNLHNGNYEHDICKFYTFYKSNFYNSTFSINKKDYPLIDFKNENKSRDYDFEMGVSRLKYDAYKKQFNIFAPIYITSKEDLPDYLEVVMIFRNKLDIEYKRTFRIYVNGYYENDVLNTYIKRYASKLDDKVIFCLRTTGQANYYGIDLNYGGFVKKIDNEINNLFIEQNTNNNADYIITDGFKRHNIIMKQILPLSFSFNLEDISKNLYNSFKNYRVKFSCYWVKDGTTSEYHDFGLNYNEMYVSKFYYDNIYNRMVNTIDTTNIMNMNNPSLCEGRYINYHFANKLKDTYVRWKLSISPDTNPYIINTSIGFSAFDKKINMYKELPKLGKPLQGFCDIVNNKDYNIILPIGEDFNERYVNTHVTNETAKLVGSTTKRSDKYAPVLESLIPYKNFFDSCVNCIYDVEKANSNIFTSDNIHWMDVKDNRCYKNGIFYNLDYISNNLNQEFRDKKIDKFSIIVTYKNDIYTNDEVNDNFIRVREVLHGKNQMNVLKIYKYNAIVNNSEKNYGIDDHIYEKEYSNENETEKYFYENNKIFKKDPNGPYINVSAYYGTKLYDMNKYYDYSYIMSINDISSNMSYNGDIYTGYQLVHIYNDYDNTRYPYINKKLHTNITLRNGNLLEYTYISKDGMITPINYVDVDNEKLFEDAQLLIKKNFISYSSIIFPEDPERAQKLNEALSNCNSYYYYPVCYVDEQYIGKNIFEEVKDYTYFYGNKINNITISEDKLLQDELKDKRFLYIDALNIPNGIDDKGYITDDYVINDDDIKMIKLLNRQHLYYYLTKFDNYFATEPYKNVYIGKLVIDPTTLKTKMQYELAYKVYDNVNSWQDLYMRYDNDTNYYVLRKLVLLTDKIVDKIQLYDNKKFYDVYLYRLENKQDNRLYKNVIYTSLDKKRSDVMYRDIYDVYVPMFNEAWIENNDETKLYVNYNVLDIKPVKCTFNYIDGDITTKVNTILYRYNEYDSEIVMELPISKIGNWDKYKNYRYSLYDVTPKNYSSYDPYLYYNEQYNSYVSYSYYDERNNTYNRIYDELNAYDLTKMNSYTYNGKLYGFYIINTTLTNINTTFNLLNLTEKTKVNTFSYINGIHITDDRCIKYYKNIIPFDKDIHLQNILLSNQCIMLPDKLTFNQKYYTTSYDNIAGNNKYTGIVTKNNYESSYKVNSTLKTSQTSNTLLSGVNINNNVIKNTNTSLNKINNEEFYNGRANITLSNNDYYNNIFLLDYKKSMSNFITLYRQFDYIEPLLLPESYNSITAIPNNKIYNLKYKDVKSSLLTLGDLNKYDNPYCSSESILSYTTSKQYNKLTYITSKNNSITYYYYEPEHKWFNDSEYIIIPNEIICDNVELYIDNKNSELVEHITEGVYDISEDKLIDIFNEKINTTNINYSKKELLFLINKYNVSYNDIKIYNVDDRIKIAVKIIFTLK